ncbi:MAG: gamma-glutamyltransferase [Planctomycetes bacterium]|nr:gamma-glutamyltransferase [Planctomycetota bacterium]
MRLWSLLLLCLVTACVSPLETGPKVESTNGVVVCVDQYAAKVGTHVLEMGGNAVDAAVAMGFALAVTHPQAGNLGGGGFMVVRLEDGRLATFDYRERAPVAAKPDMFLKEDGTIDKDKIEYGFLGSGVPGTVAGFYLAHAQFGRLKWHKLLEPACQLAERGFKVDFDLYSAFQKHKDKLARFESTRKVFFRDKGELPAIGFRLDQPDLANTLRAIQHGGRDAFYRGPVAEELVRAIREGGGIMTLGDLQTYLAKERDPLRWTYNGVEIVAMGLPTSGGVILQEMLNILSMYNLRDMDEGVRAHLLVETMRRAYLDRALYLGDPDYVTAPLEEILSGRHAEMIRMDISLDERTPSTALDSKLTIESADRTGAAAADQAAGKGQTTHFCVADSEGNVVSNTYTLECTFGGGAVAGGTGVLMNNEMGDFNLRPGRTDDSGEIGTEPNLIAPRKRMLSSMCPVILLKDGKPYAAFGSPGGKSIINTVLQVIINLVDLGMTPEEAVRAPRLHHPWLPDKVYVEKTMPWHVTESLEALGHTLVKKEYIGDCHLLFFPETEWGFSIQGVADNRIDGCAAGL